MPLHSPYLSHNQHYQAESGPPFIIPLPPPWQHPHQTPPTINSQPSTRAPHRSAQIINSEQKGGGPPMSVSSCICGSVAVALLLSLLHAPGERANTITPPMSVRRTCCSCCRVAVAVVVAVVVVVVVSLSLSCRCRCRCRCRCHVAVAAAGAGSA